MTRATGCCSRGCTARGPRSVERGAEAALAFKALGDATRLAMLQMIAEADELCACEIEPSFDLSQPTISHHLRLLREAGLIWGERRGTWIYYRPNRDALRSLAQHPIFRQP